MNEYGAWPDSFLEADLLEFRPASSNQDMELEQTFELECEDAGAMSQ